MTQFKNCPQCGCNLSGLEHDKRAVRWRVRIRLYDLAYSDTEPMADTEPELHPTDPGTWEAAGLKGVADLVIQLAMNFHHTTEPLKGLEPERIDAKIPGLRPTLSRRGGNAVWRLPYDTQRTWDATGHRSPAWLARVDLERIEDKAPEPAPRPTFRRAVT